MNVGSVLAALALSLTGVIHRMRDRIRDTQDADPVSQDLLITVTAALEKQHWMVQVENRP